MSKYIPNFEFIDSKPPLSTEVWLTKEEIAHRIRHAKQYKDPFHMGQVVAYSICLHYLDCACWGDGVKISHGTMKYLNKTEEYES